MNIKITPDNPIPVELNQVAKTGKIGIQRVLRNGVPVELNQVAKTGKIGIQRVLRNGVPVELNQVAKTGKIGVQHVLRNSVLLSEVNGNVDIAVPEKLSELENDLNLIELLQIDDALSATSKNPVQNKVITTKYTELNNSLNSVYPEVVSLQEQIAQCEMSALSNIELEGVLK